MEEETTFPAQNILLSYCLGDEYLIVLLSTLAKGNNLILYPSFKILNDKIKIVISVLDRIKASVKELSKSSV